MKNQEEVLTGVQRRCVAEGCGITKRMLRDLLKQMDEVSKEDDSADIAVPVPNKVVRGIISAYNDEISEGILSGGFNIPKVGTIKPNYKPERSGRNPKTNEAIPIPEHLSARYTASKAIKDSLKNVDIVPYKEEFMAKAAKSEVKEVIETVEE